MLKRGVFLAITLLLPLLVLEGVAYLSVRVAPYLYDHRDYSLAAYNEREYQDFLKYAADPELGWDQSSDPTHTLRPNCTDNLTMYTHLKNKVRSNDSSSDPMKASVIVAGDSFTYGTDANDNETYPALLEQELGTPVANLGVGGYCPMQALLKMEKQIAMFPHARVVVLGIMYSDLLRMVGSNRVVYYGGTQNRFGLKPYIKDGNFMPVDPRAVKGVEPMMQATLESFDNDYWEKPVAKFPYSVSLAKALLTHFFRFDLDLTLARMRHKPQYYFILDLPGMKESYHSLLAHYADFAREHGLKPVIVFIPENNRDMTTGDALAQYAKESFPDTFTLVPVGQGVDPVRYTRKGPQCVHPSSYGYEMIAKTVAGAIENIDYSH